MLVYFMKAYQEKEEEPTTEEDVYFIGIIESCQIRHGIENGTIGSGATLVSLMLMVGASMLFCTE